MALGGLPQGFWGVSTREWLKTLGALHGAVGKFFLGGQSCGNANAWHCRRGAPIKTGFANGVFSTNAKGQIKQSPHENMRHKIQGEKK
ncbi:MAG: hypothetical protein ACLRFR_00835 [Clostridia bacterium]